MGDSDSSTRLDRDFPTSYEMAKKRTLMFERCLYRSERIGTDLKRLSFARMEKMLENGRFRKLSAEEALYRAAYTWNLPMLAVTNPNKPGEVRLVLDAAAKSQGKCLNDFLMNSLRNS